MPASSYQVRVCHTCGLRYPLVENHPFGERCPVCLGVTQIVSQHKIAVQTNVSDTLSEKGSEVGLSAMLDNVRSAWNVGSIFRTADGLGIGRLYLCGITPTPEDGAVRKTSLGAEQSVDWEYSRDALEMGMALKKKGHLLIALEQDSRAIPLKNWQSPRPASQPAVLIVGNEVTGVDPHVLAICEHIIHIPMYGSKRSLNVEVAFGITAFQLLSKQAQN